MRSSEYGTELFANVKNGFGKKIDMEEKWEKNISNESKKGTKTIYESSMKIRRQINILSE